MYIELGRWLCSHSDFQLETLLNFSQADNSKTIQPRELNLTSLVSVNRFMYASNPKTDRNMN